MNRRTFAAGLVAVSTPGASLGASQATPAIDRATTPLEIAIEVMHQIFAEGNVELLPEYFDGRIDLEDMKWIILDEVASAQRYDGRVLIGIEVTLGDDVHAAVAGTKWITAGPDEGRYRYTFMVEVREAKIYWFRWLTEEF